MEREEHELCVLMLPWLAYGHASPFMELAKRLSQRNFFVYFCSTLVNLDFIKNQLNNEKFPRIKLVEIQIPDLPNLPPRCHTTKFLPTHLMPILKEGFDLSAPSFSSILDTLKPDLLIYDFIQPWAPVEASRRNIPAVEFLITGAAVSGFMTHHYKRPHTEFPFPEIYWDKSEACKITQRLDSVAHGMTDTERFLECTDRSSGIVLIKSFREIEGKYLDYCSFLLNKEMVPVGPLIDSSEVHVDHYETEIIQWLNKMEKSSVVFVSFGSEYFMSKEEIEEIAYGLQLSMVNFIWVIRFPCSEELNLEKILPVDFMDILSDRGKIVNWAPQKAVLRHSSTSAFLSHCGWSSVIEAMMFGVPVIALPLQLDQPINARLVMHLGTGVEVKKRENGRFYREEVANAIREVIYEESGKISRKKAKDLSKKMKKKENEEIEVVVNKLRDLC